VTRVIRALLLAALAGVCVAAPVGAIGASPGPQIGPGFGRPTASSTFLTGISFEQPLESRVGAGTTAEILIDETGSDASFVARVPAAARDTMLRYELETPSGAAIPGTTFTARWRLTPAGGAPVLGPSVTVVYEDNRFEWRTVEGDVVRMHWYAGSDGFGRQALAIAEEGVGKAADLLEVDERDPIDFYIYADVAPFYDAIGPASRENVGGVAYPELRIMMARIDPAGIGDAWIRTVIPHELSHIVFGSAVRNPYHSPPKWMTEGLAVYLSTGYASDDRDQVEQAVRQGRLMPLTALVGQFPTSFERFILGYGESVSAIDYLVRTYGQDKLVELIRSYARGVSDDEAFQGALGVDLAGFEAGWLADLGAAAPTAYGPQPAPPGPLPKGWDAEPTGVPGASSSPSTSASPRPEPTAHPGAGGGAVNGSAAIVGAATIMVILVAFVWLDLRRRRGTRP
jgi:hypothetical protein